jgi:hypothetical protein
MASGSKLPSLVAEDFIRFVATLSCDDFSAGLRRKFVSRRIAWPGTELKTFHSRGYSLGPPDDKVAAVAVVAVASGPA